MAIPFIFQPDEAAVDFILAAEYGVAKRRPDASMPHFQIDLRPGESGLVRCSPRHEGDPDWRPSLPTHLPMTNTQTDKIALEKHTPMMQQYKTQQWRALQAFYTNDRYSHLHLDSISRSKIDSKQLAHLSR